MTQDFNKSATPDARNKTKQEVQNFQGKQYEFSNFPQANYDSSMWAKQ